MIEDAPLLTMRENFSRPAEAIVDAFRGAASTHVSDALGGRGAIAHHIRLLTSPTTMVGVALTCNAGPGDNLAVFAALEAARPGDILVAATEGFVEAAVVGDLLLGLARNCGVAGLLTDGVVRDIKGILAVGLPVFAAGLSPNSVARAGPGTVGLPVVLGGVAIESGDIIVGDSDGLVVVPRRDARRTIERLASVRAAEASFETAVAAGLRRPDFIEAILKSSRIVKL